MTKINPNQILMNLNTSKDISENFEIDFEEVNYLGKSKVNLHIARKGNHLIDNQAKENILLLSDISGIILEPKNRKVRQFDFQPNYAGENWELRLATPFGRKDQNQAAIYTPTEFKFDWLKLTVYDNTIVKNIMKNELDFIEPENVTKMNLLTYTHILTHLNNDKYHARGNYSTLVSMLNADAQDYRKQIKSEPKIVLQKLQMYTNVIKSTKSVRNNIKKLTKEMTYSTQE